MFEVLVNWIDNDCDTVFVDTIEEVENLINSPYVLYIDGVLTSVEGTDVHDGTKWLMPPEEALKLAKKEAEEEGR